MKVKISTIKSRLLKIILYLHIIMWVLYMPITQLQLALFGHRIITLFHMGIFEIVLIILYLFLNSMHINVDSISKQTIYMVIAFLIFLLLSLITNSQVSLYWRFYYLIYWITPLIVIAIMQQSSIKSESIMSFLLFIIIIHAVLIVIQHYSNNIIWSYTVDDEGNNIFYISNGYYNLGSYMDRCPGLCISGLEAGVLLIFGMIITFVKTNIKKYMKVILILLFMIATWFTGTRNVFVQLLFICAIFVIMQLKIKRKYKLTLSILATLVATALYTSLFSLLGIGSATKNIMTDTLSVGIRAKNWLYVVTNISDAGIIKILFGQGVWQSAGFGALIDNMYLELIVMIGIIGCIIYIGYLIFIAKSLSKHNNVQGFLFAAFVLSSLIYGVANVLGNSFFSLIVVATVLCNNE